jgi:4-azaleucine resistance transporter AzlC
MKLREFLAGIKAELPLLIGVIPFGMIYGVLAIGAGIPVLQAQAMSMIIFAGSSQFLFAQLALSGSPAIIIILTVAIVNLRHALYSASVAPYLKNLNPKWKLILAYLLTDEAYAVTISYFTSNEKNSRDDQRGNYRHWFLLASGLALWTTWQLSTAIGIFLGAIVPGNWSLDFTLTLTFIAIVVPGIKDKPSFFSAISAGMIALIAYSLPYKLGLLLAAVVGILVGLRLEYRS